MLPAPSAWCHPCRTEGWGAATCSSTAAAFRRWAKRSCRVISVWLTPRGSVGWKVRQEWMLYKYFWVLEIQATGKAQLRTGSVIRICISHRSDGASCDAVCLALPAPLYPSRSSKEPSDVRFVSLHIPVLSYVLENGFSFFFPIKLLSWNCSPTDSNSHQMRISVSAILARCLGSS